MRNKIIIIVLILLTVGGYLLYSQKQVGTDTLYQTTQKQDLSPAAEEIVLALKARDMNKLSEYVHPEKGLRFSSSASLNEDQDLVFTNDQVSSLFSNNQKFIWGTEDGSGLPIELTFSEYYNKYIYDKDYASASQVAKNARLGESNSINNIIDIYPTAEYIEFYIPGSEESGEMDWGSLRLVFESKNGKWYLIAIVHDQWTI